MAAPLVGKRVVIEGLSSKPELNGSRGVAVSFDDQKSRYMVQLDSGAVLSLKPACLTAEPGQHQDAGPGGGFGRGGMPGMPPGMEDIFRRFGAGGMPALPAGLKPAHLGLALMAAYMFLPRVLSSLGLSGGRLVLVALGAVVVYFVRVDGGVHRLRARVRSSLGTAAAAATRATGSPVSEAQAAFAIGAIFLFVLWRYGFSSSTAAEGSGGGGAYAAYTKGYNDGRGGLSFEPIEDVASTASAGGSSWGIGSLLKLAMAGGLIYQMGAPAGQPWSVDKLMANMRNMNPMNMIFLMNMLSSFFG